MKPRTFLLPLLSIAMTTAGAMLSVADGQADPLGGQVLVPHTSIEQRRPHRPVRAHQYENLRPHRRHGQCPSSIGRRRPGDRTRPLVFLRNTSLARLRLRPDIAPSDRLQPDR